MNAVFAGPVVVQPATMASHAPQWHAARDASNFAPCGKELPSRPLLRVYASRDKSWMYRRVSDVSFAPFGGKRVASPAGVGCASTASSPATANNTEASLGSAGVLGTSDESSDEEESVPRWGGVGVHCEAASGPRHYKRCRIYAPVVPTPTPCVPVLSTGGPAQAALFVDNIASQSRAFAQLERPTPPLWL